MPPKVKPCPSCKKQPETGLRKVTHFDVACINPKCKVSPRAPSVRAWNAMSK